MIRAKQYLTEPPPMLLEGVELSTRRPADDSNYCQL